MKKNTFRSLSVCLFMAGAAFANGAAAEVPVIHVAILGVPVGDGSYSTQQISVSVGSGNDFSGVTFGSSESKSIGTAVSSGGLRIYPDLDSSASGNPYEVFLCEDCIR